MDPRQVELSKSERRKIILLAIKDSIPWKAVGFVVYYAIAYQLTVFLPKHIESTLDRSLAALCICMVSFIVLGILALIIMASYETVRDSYMKSYNARLREAQQEALSKVDDQLLK